MFSWPSVAADAIAWSRKQVEIPDVEQQRDEENRAAEQRVHGVLVVAEIQQHRVCVCVCAGSLCKLFVALASPGESRRLPARVWEGGEGYPDAASSCKGRRPKKGLRAIPGPTARRDGASRGEGL